MAQCQGPRTQKRLFFSLHLYLAGKYCKNPTVLGAQLNLNVSQAWATTWFVGVTIYCTFFNYNSPPPHQFLCNKILLKKLATVRGMLTEQSFKLRRPGRICTPITGCFHDKAIIATQNFRLDCYLLLKYCRRQCTLVPLHGPNHLQNLTPKCKILNVFWI